MGGPKGLWVGNKDVFRKSPHCKICVGSYGYMKKTFMTYKAFPPKKFLQKTDIRYYNIVLKTFKIGGVYVRS